MKWVEFLQGYSFVLHPRLGRSNKVDDALIRRATVLITITVEMVGLKEMKWMRHMHILLKHGKPIKKCGAENELHT